MEWIFEGQMRWKIKRMEKHELLRIIVLLVYFKDPESCIVPQLAFAEERTQDDTTRKLFISRVLGAERRFFAEEGVAFDPETGMTYDGHALDETTGSSAIKGGEPHQNMVWYLVISGYIWVMVSWVPGLFQIVS